VTGRNCEGQKPPEPMTYNLRMIAPSLSRRWILPILLFGFTKGAAPQTVSELTGQWVMKLGQRTFLVLTIAPQKEGQSIAGFIVRPRNFGTSDGHSFSQISKETIQESITRSEINDGHLTIIVQNPKNPSDENSYEVSLTDTTHLNLTLVGASLDPLILTRTRETSTPATDWDESRTYSDEDSAVSNPEMKRIFEEDQKVRQSGVKIDWAAVTKSDAERREATRKLLSDGNLHTGEDFERAAFLFQHGSTPNDYLLAHTLAMIAIKKGRTSAVWIATATLDRYLQSIHQPQIYGTQYHTFPSQPTTQETYDRTLISDAIRKQLGVPSQAAQNEQRKQYDSERKIEMNP
jgi:hypothetical protein